MPKWVWFLVGTFVGLAAYVFITVFPPYEDSNTIGAPKNYYYLPVHMDAEVICTDPKSGSNLFGFAYIIAYPTEGKPDHYIIEASNAGIKEIDWHKPITSDEDVMKFVEMIRSLKPYALFHLQRSDNKKVLVNVYTRKEGSWDDWFKFWIARFDKEWVLSETQTYDPFNAQDTATAASQMMKKVYGMDCRLQ